MWCISYCSESLYSIFLVIILEMEEASWLVLLGMTLLVFSGRLKHPFLYQFLMHIHVNCNTDCKRPFTYLSNCFIAITNLDTAMLFQYIYRVL